MYELTLKEGLEQALEWLNNIKKHSDGARDIMIDTQPKDVGLHALTKALEDGYMPLPQSIQEALNSGDGTYRP